MDTAKKKAELEKRLQDVSGQLSGTKSKSKKNSGKNNLKYFLYVSIAIHHISEGISLFMGYIC